MATSARSCTTSCAIRWRRTTFLARQQDAARLSRRDVSSTLSSRSDSHGMTVRGGLWRRATWPGLLAALGLGFSRVPLARGSMFFYWDNAQQHCPQTEFLSRALRSGDLPQWWPEVGSGAPIIAEGQVAAFHPLRVLLALTMPPPVAFMMEIGLYLAIAGVATYFFLRRFGLSSAACVIGSVCQMFGSYSVVAVRNLALHRSLCLLPVAMLVAERFVRRPTLIAGLPLSLVFALQLVGGHPAPAAVTLLATFTYIVFRLVQRSVHQNDTVRAVGRTLLLAGARWMALLLLGFGIAAIQVFPTALHVGQSIRQGGLSFDYAAGALSAELRSLPMLFFPYGYHQGDWQPAPTTWGSELNPVPVTGVYIGALPVALALVAIWLRRRWPDPTWPMVISGLLATGLALGWRTPLYPALWGLPGASGLRYPGRFLMWTSFSLACLAALGFQRLLSRSRLARSRAKDLFACFVWVLSVLLLAVAFLALRPERLHGVLTSLALIALAWGMVWGILLVPRRYQRGLVLVAILFVLGDLWLFRTKSGY